MPYSLNNPPEFLKSLPHSAIEIFISAYNSAYKQYNGDEGKCAAIAWTALKRKFRKDGDKWVPKTQIEEAEELTHEEQRELEFKEYGSPYYISYPPGEMSRFVLQTHMRGLWDSETRKNLLEELEKLKSDKRKLTKFWKSNQMEYLTIPIRSLSDKLQSVDSARGDIHSAIGKYLEDTLLDPLDISNIVGRGNAHHDLRVKNPSEDSLFGFTIVDPRIVLQFLSDDSFVFPLRDKILDNRDGDKSPAVQKARQPLEWLNLVSSRKPVFEAKAGEVGGTAETSGRIIYCTEGEAVVGVIKDDYVEIFLKFNKPYTSLSGRWGFQKLEGSPLYNKVPIKWWMFSRVYSSIEPYILTHNRELEESKAVKDGLTKIFYNPQIISTIQSDLVLKSLLSNVSADKINEKVKEFSGNGGKWSKES